MIFINTRRDVCRRLEIFGKDFCWVFCRSVLPPAGLPTGVLLEEIPIGILVDKNLKPMLLRSAGQDNLELYEYACEVPHKLFKFKSLSSTQNYVL